jgi:hypothetical protein
VSITEVDKWHYIKKIFKNNKIVKFKKKKRKKKKKKPLVGLGWFGHSMVGKKKLKGFGPWGWPMTKKYLEGLTLEGDRTTPNGQNAFFLSFFLFFFLIFNFFI